MDTDSDSSLNHEGDLRTNSNFEHDLEPKKKETEKDSVETPVSFLNNKRSKRISLHEIKKKRNQKI